MIEVTEKLIIKNISFFHVVTHRTSVRYSKHWDRGFLSGYSFQNVLASEDCNCLKNACLAFLSSEITRFLVNLYCESMT